MTIYKQMSILVSAFLLFVTVVYLSPSVHAAAFADNVAGGNCFTSSGAVIEFGDAIKLNQAKNSMPACTSINVSELGFQIPSLGDILTFVIRVFFVIAGIAALFYMLIGAFAWVTSGGDKDAVTAAREKIQAAVIGMIMIVAVLAVIWTLEQVIFKRKICLGLSCPLTLPGLIKTDSTSTGTCCVCIKPDKTLGQIVNTSTYKCDTNGEAAKL